VESRSKDRSEGWDEQRRAFNKYNVADSVGAWHLVRSEWIDRSLDLLVGDGPEFAYWGVAFVVGVNKVFSGAGRKNVS
jgi:hypothetical protein